MMVGMGSTIPTPPRGYLVTSHHYVGIVSRRTGDRNASPGPPGGQNLGSATAQDPTPPRGRLVTRSSGRSARGDLNPATKREPAGGPVLRGRRRRTNRRSRCITRPAEGSKPRDATKGRPEGSLLRDMRTRRLRDIEAPFKASRGAETSGQSTGPTPYLPGGQNSAKSKPSHEGLSWDKGSP